MGRVDNNGELFLFWSEVINWGLMFQVEFQNGKDCIYLLIKFCALASSGYCFSGLIISKQNDAVITWIYYAICLGSSIMLFLFGKHLSPCIPWIVKFVFACEIVMNKRVPSVVGLFVWVIQLWNMIGWYRGGTLFGRQIDEMSRPCLDVITTEDNLAQCLPNFFKRIVIILLIIWSRIDILIPVVTPRIFLLGWNFGELLLK